MTGLVSYKAGIQLGPHIFFLPCEGLGSPSLEDRGKGTILEAESTPQHTLNLLTP